jgi:hypothetical protein
VPTGFQGVLFSSGSGDARGFRAGPHAPDFRSGHRRRANPESGKEDRRFHSPPPSGPGTAPAGLDRRPLTISEVTGSGQGCPARPPALRHGRCQETQRCTHMSSLHRHCSSSRRMPGLSPLRVSGRLSSGRGRCGPGHAHASLRDLTSAASLGVEPGRTSARAVNAGRDGPAPTEEGGGRVPESGRRCGLPRRRVSAGERQLPEKGNADSRRLGNARHSRLLMPDPSAMGRKHVREAGHPGSVGCPAPGLGTGIEATPEGRPSRHSGICRRPSSEARAGEVPRAGEGPPFAAEPWPAEFRNLPSPSPSTMSLHSPARPFS